MADPQHVVDDIRSFLLSTDQQLTDSVRQLAQQYAAACTDANQRLRRCAEFLSRGLRSEAIHLAQAEPVLLDLVATLDFSERPQWEQVCLMYGLPAGPALQMETASALNEAYADDQPLEELLRKHRLLALARAPLYPRLQLLRRIAEIDVRNTIWAEDVKEFERARLQHIANGLDVLVRAANVPGLKSAQEELTRPGWLVPVPQSLLTRVQNSARSVSHAHALAALRKLEAPLFDAMNAFDVARASQLRREWNGHLQAFNGVNPCPSDPLWGRTQIVFEWIEQQASRSTQESAYQKALADLEKGLNASCDRLQLERLAHGVLKHERGMPEALHHRYNVYLQHLQSAGRRRRVLMIAVPAACLLIAAAVGYWWMNRSEEGQKLTTAVTTLEQMLDAGQVAEARAYLNKLSESEPTTAQKPRVVELQVRLQGEEKRLRERKTQFDHALAAARTAGLDAAGDRMLDAARALAEQPEEVEAVQNLAAARKTQRDEIDAKRDLSFQPRIAELGKSIGKLEDLLQQAGEPATLLAQLSEREIELALLSADTVNAGAKTRDAIAQLRGRLDAARKTVAQQNLEGLLLADITRALSNKPDAAAFAQAAERYLKEYPESPRAKHLKKSVAEQSLWDAPLAWAPIARAVGKQPLEPAIKDAKTQLETCRKYLTQYPKAPDLPTIDLYVKCLEAVVQRDESDPKAAPAAIRKALADLTVKDLYFLKMEDGRTYYSSEDLSARIKDSTDGHVRFKYLSSADGTKMSSAVRKINDVARHGRAPQSVVADKIKFVEDLSLHGWEEFTLGLAQQVRDDKDIDPVLKVKLLQKLLDGVARGSYPLGQSLAGFREAIAKPDFDLTVPWFDPGSKEASKLRPQAKEFVDKLASLKQTLKNAKAEKQKIENALLASERSPVGCLLRDKDGNWQCRSATPLPRTGALFVLIPDDEHGASWQMVGKIANGKISIAGSPDALVEGRLVFASQSSN